MPYPKALNHDEEREVFTAWSQDKEQVGALAGRYGVSRNTIHAAITRVLEQSSPTPNAYLLPHGDRAGFPHWAGARLSCSLLSPLRHTFTQIDRRHV